MLNLRSWIAPLHERSFRLFFIGQGSSLIGSAMLSIALVLAVVNAGGDASSVGLVLAAQTIPTMVIAIFAGAIADRFGRKLLMVASDVLRAFSQGALAVLIITGHAEIWSMAVLAAITGIGDAFFIPATSGLIVECVSEENRRGANALSELAQSISTMIGPVAAGGLLVVFQPGALIAVNALSYVCSAVCLTLLKPKRRFDADSDSRTLLVSLVNGWKQFASRSWIWTVLVQFMIFHVFVFAPYLVLGPVRIFQHSGPAAWGIIQGGLGVGAVIGGIMMLRLRFRFPVRTAVIAQIGWVPIVAALSWIATPLIVFVALAFIAGVGSSLFNIAWETSVQDHVPTSNLSSVNAYDWALSTASLSAGLALAGPLAGWLGQAHLLIGGALLQVVTCLLLLAVPSVRSLPRANVASSSN